ncbi:hypothetical protein AgCh_011936 [Apium graveolens]
MFRNQNDLTSKYSTAWMVTMRASDELDPMGWEWNGPLGHSAWVPKGIYKSRLKLVFWTQVIGHVHVEENLDSFTWTVDSLKSDERNYNYNKNKKMKKNSEEPRARSRCGAAAPAIDELQEEKFQLKRVVDFVFEDARDSPLNQNPSIVTRLESLIRTVNEHLRTMVSYRDLESQLVVQMIADELQRIVTQLRADDSNY